MSGHFAVGLQIHFYRFSHSFFFGWIGISWKGSWFFGESPV